MSASSLGAEWLPKNKRSFSAGDLLREIADKERTGDQLLLDNLELLFEPDLQSSPLESIRRLAHSKRVVAVWPTACTSWTMSWTNFWSTGSKPCWRTWKTCSPRRAWACCLQLAKADPRIPGLTRATVPIDPRVRQRSARGAVWIGKDRGTKRRDQAGTAASDSPSTLDDLRERFDALISDHSKGKDATKLRFVIE
jgi:hypothetical protein